MKKLFFAFIALSLPTMVLAGGYGVPGPIILSPVEKQVPQTESSVVPEQSPVVRTRTLPTANRLSRRFSDSSAPVLSSTDFSGTDLQRENLRQSAARQKLMRLRSIGR
ncbi:hypothetical protein K9L27_03085 [Candidatus Gracilibacteria bacterium]|nr:hypothetical protein [Candidatus Gracilibacteria bacterium]